MVFSYLQSHRKLKCTQQILHNYTGPVNVTLHPFFLKFFLSQYNTLYCFFDMFKTELMSFVLAVPLLIASDLSGSVE